MKKTIAIMLVIAFLVAGLFILTGCGEENKTNSDNQSNGENQSSKEVTIVGSWKTQAYGADYVYTFNADGTGKYDAAGTVMEFTYTTEGSKISILYTGNTDPFETEYSIDGETLNVKDSLGKDTLYSRVK